MTNKSKLTKELILIKITENTTKYTWSNLCMNNEMLVKIDDDNGFYLFYTGGSMKIRSLYWTYLYVKEDGKTSFIRGAYHADTRGRVSLRCCSAEFAGGLGVPVVPHPSGVSALSVVV